MACSPDAVMQQEEGYFAALEAATHFSISGDELRLGKSGAEPSLVFRR
jgi:heat shock protein HslJ